MRIVRLLSLLLVFLWVLPALAQDNEIVELDGGYTMVIPVGWEEVDQDETGMLLENGDSSILVLNPIIMEEVLGSESPENATEALLIAFDVLYEDGRVAEADILPLTGLTPYDTVLYTVTASDPNVFDLFFTAQIETGRFLGFIAITNVDDFVTTLDAVVRMLESLEEADGIPTGEDAVLATPSSTGSGDSQPDDGSGESEPGGIMFPQLARWQLTLDASASVSCPGRSRVAMPSSQFFASLTLNVSVSPSVPRVILVNGERFTLQTNYTFVGNLDLGSRTVAEVSLTFTSSTTLTGEMVFDAAVSGTTCSVTVLLSGRR